jgi:hypothetical protein
LGGAVAGVELSNRIDCASVLPPKTVLESLLAMIEFAGRARPTSPAKASERGSSITLLAAEKAWVEAVYPPCLVVPVVAVEAL